MNGWTNYETWNVTLWVANDERLYRLASDCRSYAEFRARVWTEETLDGVNWHDPNLDLPAINDWWNDTFSKRGFGNLRQSPDGSYLRYVED